MKYSSTPTLFLMTALSLFSLNGFAQTASPLHNYLAADLRDITQFRGREFPLVGSILNDFARNVREVLPATVRYRLAGATKSGLNNTVLGVRLADVPSIRANGEGEAILWVSYNFGRATFYRKLRFALTGAEPGGHLRVVSREVLETVPLSEVAFHIQVDLYERQLLLESDSHPGIRSLFPLGVGMFDEGVTQASGSRTRLVTPEFRNAFLRKRHVNPEKEDGFAWRPFMPLSDSSGRPQNIAFHIMPISGRHLSPRSRIPRLQRGFVSNGCMRMRERDVYELFFLFVRGAREAVPTQLLLRSGQRWAQPYPQVNNRYSRVKNFGTPDHPEVQREAHDGRGRPLRVHEYVRGAPPALSNIWGINGENMTLLEDREYTEPSLQLELPSREETPAFPGDEFPPNESGEEEAAA